MARYAATPDGIVQYTAEEEAVRDADVARFEDYLANHKYKDDRRIAYASLGDQLDMQYKDQLNGTTTWKDHIAKVKSDHPKPE
jgi:hypothetical protein